MVKFDCIVPGRLWAIDNLLPPNQVHEILNVNWQSLPVENSIQQKHWLRNAIHWDCAVVQSLTDYFNQQLDCINHAIGTQFTQAFGQFWVDQPGFTVPMHTDGHLANSLQMYWIAPSEHYGTGFYHFNNKNSLLYQFRSRPNTGYLMLNHPDDDGSQPLQWHGMFNPVPAGSVRVSSYWSFD